MKTSDIRLIEAAFPLIQVSLDSVHEKTEFDSFHPENEANPRWVAKPVSNPHRPGPHGGEARLPAGVASVDDGGDGRRLIESAFPLKEASIDSVHEKNVRHGHISTLHGDDGAPDQQTAFDPEPPESNADFPWHLRAWGRRVLAEARRELASRYPTYAEFEPARRKGRRGEAPLPPKLFPSRSPLLLAPDAQGRVSVKALNAALDPLDLEAPRSPRWIAKPTVVYLWALTAECGHCRAGVPLLKTLWLCKRDDKRVRLAMAPRDDGSGVDFALEREAPGSGGAARRRIRPRHRPPVPATGWGPAPSCGRNGARRVP